MAIYILLLFIGSQCVLLLTPCSWDKIATCFRVSHWLQNTRLFFIEWFDKVTVSFFSVKDFLLLFSGLIRLFCQLRKLMIRPFCSKTVGPNWPHQHTFGDTHLRMWPSPWRRVPRYVTVSAETGTYVGTRLRGDGPIRCNVGTRLHGDGHIRRWVSPNVCRCGQLGPTD